MDLYWFALGPGAYHTTPQVGRCAKAGRADRLQTQVGRWGERLHACSIQTLPPRLYRQCGLERDGWGGRRRRHHITRRPMSCWQKGKLERRQNHDSSLRTGLLFLECGSCVVLSSDTGRGYPPRLTHGGNAGLRSRYTAPWLAEPHVAWYGLLGMMRRWVSVNGFPMMHGWCRQSDGSDHFPTPRHPMCLHIWGLGVFQQQRRGTSETCGCGCQGREVYSGRLDKA